MRQKPLELLPQTFICTTSLRIALNHAILPLPNKPHISTKRGIRFYFGKNAFSNFASPLGWKGLFGDKGALRFSAHSSAVRLFVYENPALGAGGSEAPMAMRQDKKTPFDVE